jgi:hypothetical protein
MMTIFLDRTNKHGEPVEGDAERGVPGLTAAEPETETARGSLWLLQVFLSDRESAALPL